MKTNKQNNVIITCQIHELHKIMENKQFLKDLPTKSCVKTFRKCTFRVC